MDGNCVECGFPVAVHKTGRIACPFCSTINSAVVPGTTPGKWLAVGIIGFIAFIVVKSAKRRA